MGPSYANPIGEDVVVGRDGMELDAERIVSSDYFRMFVFKVEKCSRADPHDWTLCQFAHPTEKAKRRDPTKFVYNYNSCTEFRKHGTCRSGDDCAFAHGVFEGWLSAAKYHTEMCTLGRQACTRRVCFFAHSPSELREKIPQTLEETGQLRDQLLTDMFTKNVYASVLERILRVMTPNQASEVIGERLAHLQFFLSQFGPQALPALLRCSHSDLQDLMASLKTQAQNEAVTQQRIEAHTLSRLAESNPMNNIANHLSDLYGRLPLNETDAANLFSRFSVSNPPSSEDQYSGRSSLDSYFNPSSAPNQFVTPPRCRSSSLSAGYARSTGESSGTHEARSSMDSGEAMRGGPNKSRIRVGSLFGLPPTAESLEEPQERLMRPPMRHSLDNAYQQALVAKNLGASLQSPMQSPLNGLSAYLPPAAEPFSGQQGLFSNPQLPRSGSVDPAALSLLYNHPRGFAT